jgi:hypothetical protein
MRAMHASELLPAALAPVSFDTGPEGPESEGLQVEIKMCA